MSTIWINRPRLKIRGYFGELAYQALELDILAGRIWRAALLRSDVSGLVRYHFGSSGNGLDWNDEKPPAIGLAYTLGFSDADNLPSAWTLERGPASMLESLPNPFGNGKKGLAHTDSTPGISYTYRSPFTIDANRPFTIPLYLFKPELSETATPNADLWELLWDMWRLEVRGGACRLMRYNITYTDDNGAQQPISLSQCQSLETQLKTLLQNQSPTAADEEQMAAIRRQIYEIDQPLSLRENSDLHRGSRGTAITFIPSPSGYLLIETDSGARRHNGSIRGESIEIPSITSTRKEGQVWNSTPLRIRTNGIAFEWQSGFPLFNYVGKLKLGEYSKALDNSTDENPNSTLPVRGRANFLPGTGITFPNHQVKAGPQPPLVTITRPDGSTVNSGDVSGMFAQLTSDGRYSPFLFAADLYVLPGARNGSDDIVYDTDQHLDSMGAPPILDVAPQYESNSRRSTCKVRMRRGQCIDGTLDFETMPELTGRLIDIAVKIDDANPSSVEVPLFTKCVVKNEMWDDVQTLTASAATGAIAQSVIPNPWTEGEIEVGDPQTLLDEDLMEHQPVGDGLTLWRYFNLVLKDGGWRPGEMYEPDDSLFVDPTRVLPSAQGNEQPCVQPAVGVSRGDFLRGLFDKHGMGRRYWWDHRAGKWRVGFPSDTVKAAFSTAAGTAMPFRIYNLSPITDPAEFFNGFRVEGAKDPKTGLVIACEDYIYESFRKPSDPRYIGRIKMCPTVKDEGLKTPDEVLYVWRSLFKRYGLAPKFYQFTTDFVPDLYPMDAITVNSKLCRIERIPSADLRDKGSLTIAARRLQF